MNKKLNINTMKRLILPLIIISSLLIGCKKDSISDTIENPVHIPGLTNKGIVILKDGPYDYPDNNDTLLWGMNVRNDSSTNILYLHGKSITPPDWFFYHSVGDTFTYNTPW
jgi:hypothetical protein